MIDVSLCPAGIGKVRKRTNIDRQTTPGILKV